MGDFEEQIRQAISKRRNRLAQQMVSRQYRLQPQLKIQYGKEGRTRYLQQAQAHLLYLSESIAAAQMALFQDYVAWAKALWAARGLPVEDLANQLAGMAEVLAQQLSPAQRDLPLQYIAAAREHLPALPLEIPPFLTQEKPHAELADRYLQALLQGKRHAASRLILDAVEGGISVKEIYLDVFQPVQYEIGRLWQINRISVAHEHYCTAATQLIMSQLYPYLFSGQRQSRRLVVACVSDELHEIGARMVADLFELEGWSTIYLGANAPAADIVKLLTEHKADALGVSATMSYHIRAVRELIAAVRADARCRGVKILVGGYPFTMLPHLGRESGADGTARDAGQAITLANQLLAEK